MASTPSRLLRFGPVRLVADLSAAARSGSATLGHALRHLPRPAAYLALALLVSAVLPSALQVIAFSGALDDAPALSTVATRPVLAWGLALALALLSLVLFERPRSWSPAAYGRQLRARAILVRAQYLTAVRGDNPQPPKE